MRSIALLAAVLVTFVGCALPTRRFIDASGSPVRGVLVISERSGFILTSHRVSLAVTDADGRAVVSDAGDVAAFREGLHPWIPGWPEDRRCWSPSQASTLVMYPDIGGPQPEVNVTLHTLTFARAQDDLQILALPAALGVTLECVDRTTFRATARDGHLLLQSPRFYFEGPEADGPTTALTQEDELYFYSRDPQGRVHKVGVTRAWDLEISMRKEIDGHMRQVPAESIELMWTHLGDECCRFEPRRIAVRAPCVDERTELVVGNEPRLVLEALEAAIARGDLENDQSAESCLAALRARVAQRD